MHKLESPYGYHQIFIPANEGFPHQIFCRITVEKNEVVLI
jgi:hypothetical protein